MPQTIREFHIIWKVVILYSSCNNIYQYSTTSWQCLDFLYNLLHNHLVITIEGTQQTIWIKPAWHYEFTNSGSKTAQRTEMELYIFDFYCAWLPVPSQLTRCCDDVVNKVVGNLHQQLLQQAATAFIKPDNSQSDNISKQFNQICQGWLRKMRDNSGVKGQRFEARRVDSGDRVLGGGAASTS